MGITEEVLKMNIHVNGEYSYKGKKLDSQSLDMLEKNVQDTVFQAMYDSVDSELCCIEGEDLDNKSEHVISIDITYE